MSYKTPYYILPDPEKYDSAAHLARIRKLFEKYPLNTDEKRKRYIEILIQDIPEHLRFTFANAISDLLIQERVFLRLDDPPMPSNAVTYQIYSDDEKFLTQGAANLDKISKVLIDFISELAGYLPDGDGAFSVPLAEFIPTHLIERLYSHYPDKPFPLYRQQFLANVFQASGMDIDREYTETQLDRLVFPTLSELSPLQMAETYLKHTPLQDIFTLPISFSIPDSARNEHFLCIARTGSGKTQLIQRDILQNLLRPDSPGMLVIDSQNQMIPKLERLQAARDRIVIVDPFDVSPPALNMFASPERKRDYDPNLKEAIEANTLQQFAWIFSALDQELTGRQTTLFSFTARILLSMQSNMQTLLEFMQIEKPAELRASKFWRYIEAADEQTRYFFDNRFCTNDYNRTKGGVADRLLGVLRVPAFSRMFMATENRLDLYTELENRKLVVFNTHKSRLGNDASAILGRYAISLYIRAAFERELDTAPPPAFLYVDEASEYFGKKDSSDTLFTQLRKYNCGTFVAFQDLSQLGEQHHTLVSNTGTKLTGGLSVADAKKLAPDMRTSEQELMNVRKAPGVFEFMCYVDNVTPRAIKLSFEYGAVENAPKLDQQALTELRENNRQRIGSRKPTESTPSMVKTTPVAAPPTTAQPTSAPPTPVDRPADTPQIKPGKDW